MAHRSIIKLFCIASLACLTISGSRGQADVKDNAVYYSAFSHNDYWRTKPLWDAFSYRFNCVEADLWLIDGELLVGHDRTELTPERTFDSLYLKPLIERIRENGGKVYPQSDRPFFLMIDCKTFINIFSNPKN